MRIKVMLLASAVAVATGIPARAATLVNGGFETGLSSWSYSTGEYQDVINGPLVDVIGSVFDALGTTEFTDESGGGHFAHLTAGADPGDMSTYTLLSQAFVVDAGAVLSLRSAFIGNDYEDYNDDGFVRLIRLGGPVTIVNMFTSSISNVGSFGATPWATFTSGSLAAGLYRLEAGVRDRVPDGGEYYPGYHSQLLLDQVVVTGGVPAQPGGVPEPATWGLMILGFGLAGAALRRRRLLPAR